MRQPREAERLPADLVALVAAEVGVVLTDDERRKVARYEVRHLTLMLQEVKLGRPVPDAAE